MKTSFTKVAILALIIANALLTTSVQAKMSDRPMKSNNLAEADLNIENEINTNLQQMLLALDTDILKNQITKQLTDHALELQTDQMVKGVDGQLPAFKFKVVIAD